MGVLADGRLGYEGTMCVLAFDHRGSFQRDLFGVHREPDERQTSEIAAAKRIVFDGLVAATETGRVPADRVGVLVDDQFGGEVPELARERGMLLMMPAEKSDQQVFQFEHGDEYGDWIARYRPGLTKVLVRHNVEGDAEGNRVQLDRLKVLADWLHENGFGFLFELLVPPTEEQLARVDADKLRYERELRPELIRRGMEEAQEHGIEVDVWKLEGIDTTEQAEALVEQARNAEHRREVVCVLLGAGAPRERVEHWIQTVAPVEGFSGFAIGRSIWKEPLERHLAGQHGREDTVGEIARRYLSFVEFYERSTS